MSCFKNKVIIITGASSGIGKEMALELSRQDCKLVLAARSIDKLDEIAESVRSNGSKALAIKCDIQLESDCRNLIDSTINKFGKIDFLINNAGTTSRALIEQTQTDVLRELMEVNFWGAVRLTKLALPHLHLSKGTVVATSSVIGKVPVPGRSGYAAAKHALEGFFETLKMELSESGVEVLIIRPSYTKTQTRFNAMTANGSRQNYSTLDESKLMPAITAAKKIISAIANKNHRFTLGKKMEGSWLILLYGLFPTKISNLILKNIRKEKYSLFEQS